MDHAVVAIFVELSVFARIADVIIGWLLNVVTPLNSEALPIMVALLIIYIL